MVDDGPLPVPERAIYGYVLYLLSYVGLSLYLVWAYVPDKWLHAASLTYLPQKYWAIAAPCFACVCIIMLLFFYFVNCFLMTPALNSKNTITDRKSKPVEPNSAVPGAIPALGDIDISEVCRNLYLTTKDR